MEPVDFVLYFHVLFWVYIVFGGFISKSHAKFILFFLIPYIYILHICPKHILISMESRLLGLDDLPTEERTKIIDARADGVVPGLSFIRKCLLWCDDHTTFSPLSAQGMLILAAIITSHRI
jgi:hypothetical protein